MSDAIISLENLGKKYRITHQVERQRYTALREVIAEKTKSLFPRSQTSDLRPLSVRYLVFPQDGTHFCGRDLKLATLNNAIL